ncbi:MAG: hypothetical protein JNM94_14075 [Phycisphaerae bacterium]|nr:hypothetical protein [Phycisphaerae bacterium]
MTHARTRRRTRLSALATVALGAIAVASPIVAMPSIASAQLSKVLNELNQPWDRVQDTNESWKPVLTAFLDMTPPPVEITTSFDLSTLYPGMDNWSAWTAWAEKNAGMGKALVDNQNKLAFAMPYGDEKVDAAFRNRGLFTKISIEPATQHIDAKYLNAMNQIAAYSIVETWRLAAAGKFEESFALGVGAIKIFRQLADQTLVREQVFALNTMSELLMSQREIMFAFVDKVPAELMQKLGTKEYPGVRPADGHRLRRLVLPEGDRIVAAAILAQCFDDNDQPSPELFAQVFASLQSANAPLERFGAARRWNAIAELHGSREASNEKLGAIYDDWYRRWNTRDYDAMMTVPTTLSLVNPIRYAAVVLSVSDLQDAFRARRRAIAELNGTIMSAALVGYYRTFGSWPDDNEKIYSAYMPRRFDFDPYDTEYGRLLFRYMATARPIDTVWGPISVQGPVIYARNEDHADDQFRSHEAAGDSGDFVLWPPLRQMSRGSGGQ